MQSSHNDIPNCILFSYCSHCENNNLTCEMCPEELPSTVTPTLPLTTPTPLPFSTAIPEGTCDRAMDLAFLVDGSSALTEEDFRAVKRFILTVVEPFRMGSAHTRATVLLFHSGVKSNEMQVQKWIFRKMVQEMKYSGGNIAFMDEAIKYLSVYIYDKDKRVHAGRVAILLTASPNPRPMRSIQRLLKKKDIITLAVAIGPKVNMMQINEITKANPDSRAYILSSTEELDDRIVEVRDYLCTLGLEPEVPKPKPTQAIVVPVNPVTSGIGWLVTPTERVLTPTTTATLLVNQLSTTQLSTWAMKDITFVIEGSDNVGETDFNKTKEFLESIITELSVREEHIRFTVVQYSLTITVEFTRMDFQQRQQALEEIRKIRWRGGSATNTGTALRTVTQTTSVQTQPSTEQKLNMVFMVTSNPPTDQIQRPTELSNTVIYPIGVGPKIREVDLEPFSFPQKPIMVDSYNSLNSIVNQLVNITQYTRITQSPILSPREPTLAPRPTLPTSGNV